MEQQSRIVVVEMNHLEALVTKIVTEQMKLLVDELRELIHRKENPLDGNHITTKQLMKEIGVTRNTIQNYRRQGILPPPKFDLSGRPYWTAEQLRAFLNERKGRGKFPE